MNRDIKVILDKLLDRYERSGHYRRDGQSHRGVFLKYDRETMPDYWDERQGERRLELNQATLVLERAGFIRVRRSHYSREEIERVDLVLDRVDEVYRQADRVPRRALESQLASVASGWAARWPDDWRRAFARAVVCAVESYDRIPTRLSADEADLLDELCRVLEALGPTGLAPEVPRRVFSQRVLGSSKRLEAIQLRLLRVLREFWPGQLPDNDREALAELGIVENPQQVLVAGPMVLDGLDIGATGSDVGFSAPFVERCRVSTLEAEAVITVENLTSFYQVVTQLPPRTVAVYLGGYHNTVRRRFLQKLAQARSLRFCHWGDIDLGGFRIFVHLREQAGLDLEPLLMDLETYRSHQEGGMAFGEAYGKDLAGLLDQKAHAPFWPVIREMLVHHRRVEQESVEFRWG